jgi:hypothetical protein
MEMTRSALCAGHTCTAAEQQSRYDGMDVSVLCFYCHACLPGHDLAAIWFAACFAFVLCSNTRQVAVLVHVQHSGLIVERRFRRYLSVD